MSETAECKRNEIDHQCNKEFLEAHSHHKLQIATEEQKFYYSCEYERLFDKLSSLAQLLEEKKFDATILFTFYVGDENLYYTPKTDRWTDVVVGLKTL